MIDPPSSSIGTDPHPDGGTLNRPFRFGWHSNLPVFVLKGFLGIEIKIDESIVIDRHEA